MSKIYSRDKGKYRYTIHGLRFSFLHFDSMDANFFGQVWSKTCDYDLYIWKLLWLSWTSHNVPNSGDNVFAMCRYTWGFYFLVFIRFFGGLFGGTATVASAFVVDLYPQKKRADSLQESDCVPLARLHWAHRLVVGLRSSV